MDDRRLPSGEMPEVVQVAKATYSREDKNLQVTFKTVADMTPTAATAAIEIERARAEAERHKADADRYRAEASVRQVEAVERQNVAMAREGTGQAQEITKQSEHRLDRVRFACFTLLAGLVAIVAAPQAATQIAEMIGGVLVVAVGGSFIADTVSKKRGAPALPPKSGKPE